MRLFSRLRSISGDDAPRIVYRRIVEQARRPGFFRDCGVPDTVDGRFDAVGLHVFLVLRRLRREPAHPERAKLLAQALFDTMFANMDESLREMGVGDLSVGRKVRQMAEALYGRIAAYDAGLDAGDAALEAALRRNLYRTPEAAPATAVARYLRREDAALARIPFERLAAGELDFGPPPSAESGFDAGRR